MSTDGSIFTSAGFGFLAPLREQGDLVSVLDLVDGVIVWRSVRFGPPDDPDVGRWRIDPLGSVRQLELIELIAQFGAPAGRGDQEMAGPGSGGPPARRRKHVRPHVEHGQQVIAPPVSGAETTTGSFVKSSQALEYSVSKFGRTTTFMSAGGNSGMLLNRLGGPPIAPGLASILVSCFRVMSIDSKG